MNPEKIDWVLKAYKDATSHFKCDDDTFLIKYVYIKTGDNMGTYLDDLKSLLSTMTSKYINYQNVKKLTALHACVHQKCGWGASC